MDESIQGKKAKESEFLMVEKHTYGQILKSSALIGGSSVLNIAIRIIYVKVMAVLLGPAGYGLMGLYKTITDLAQNIAGMGINSSGVRQIAEATGSGETVRIAQTVTVLRWTSIFLGLLGAVLLALFSRQVSTLTFGNGQHTTALMLLSLVVFFNLVAAGQGALIQGMRRISDLAKMGVFGTLLGTIISVPIIYFLHEKGVALSLVAVALSSVIISWWFSRRVKIQPTIMMASQIRQETASLLKFGFVFMVVGFLTMGSAYTVNIMVLRMVGLEGTGYYQAAWTLGGLYVGFILEAMGADFYPRLTAINKDNAASNRIVNEQVQVSMLLAGPGAIATLTFSPIVIALFYTTRFGGAVEILRWFCLGMALRMIIWPISFIIIAKGERILFLGADIAWTSVNIGLSWIFLKYFGLNGVGIAFFGAYIFQGLIIYLIVRRLSSFRWSSENKQMGMLFLSSIAVVFLGFYIFPLLWAIVFGTLIMILSCIYSIRVLIRLTSFDMIPGPIQRLLVWFRFVESGS